MKTDMRQLLPRYDELTAYEKLFIRLCCYVPPKASAPAVTRTNEQSVAILKRSLGEGFVDWIQGRSVLDVGCGEGEYAVAIASMGAKHVHGIDLLTPKGGYQQLAETEGVSDRVTVEVMDIADVPTGSYYTVFSHDAFEHFNEPSAMLAEMIRVCRPGGRLYIKFAPIWKSPYGRHMGGMFRKDRPWVHLFFPERTIMRVHSVYRRSETFYEHFADKEGGLNCMTIKKFNRILAEHESVVRQLEYRLIPSFSYRTTVFLSRLAPFREYLNGGIMVALEKR